MSKTVDSRVVEMQFDNRQFERNVSTTMSTLEKLKQKLNFSGASKGLEEVNHAANKVNFSGITSGIETVNAKFSYLQASIQHQLNNIVDAAVSTGKRMASALTIDPIKTGFSEYETQINAVQTILANTESKGTTLNQVNSALDELNKYADKTIYNFTEMTKNIGTFTAAGVDLETSVSAIQGIANLAAVSGSTSQQASTAMYQLSQALSSGTVKLMDWNSVVNAGMGGQVFQDALKQTARVHGIAIDQMIKDEGSFRETLSKGWLTSDILTETLNQFTMAAEEGSAEWEAYKKSLMDTGYTEEQALSILKMANTATDAATKVKTFTQLWDTLKESAQSGWTESWEIMIGDFEEAKAFLTDISDRIGSIIGESADARNKVLLEGLSSGWKQLLGAGIADEEGYKEIFKSVADEHGKSIDDMIASEKKLDDSLTDTEAFQKALKTGFKDGSLTADMLTESVHDMADKMSNMSAEELKAAGYTQEHVTQIKELSAGLKNGSISMDDFVNKIVRTSGRENIIQALWNSFDGLMSMIKPIKEAFREIFPPITGDQVYKLTERIRDLTETFKLSDDQALKLKSAFKGLFSIFDIGWSAIKALIGGIADLLRNFTGFGSSVLDTSANIGDFISNLRDSIKETNFFGNAIDKIVGYLTTAVTKIKEFAHTLTSGFSSSESSGIFGFLKGLWSIVTKVGSAITKTFGSIGGTIAEVLGKGDIFEVINSGLIAGILLGINKLTSSLDNAFKDVGSFIGNITGILDDVRGCLEAYQEQLKAGALLKIAASIGILAASLFLLSTIDADSLGTAIVAITTLFAELAGLTTIMNKFGGKSSIFDSTPAKMIAMSVSILILASAFKSLSGLSWEQMAVGLVGVSAILWELVAASIVMSKTGSKMIKGSIGLIALAAAIKILASACKDFSTMSWEDIGKGLSAIGGLLLEISIFENIAGKAKHVISTGLSLLLVAASLKILASALEDFGSIDPKVIVTGLIAIGGALAELVIAMNLMPKGSLFKATGLLIAVASLKLLSNTLSDFGSMDWNSIGKGLTAMGGSLAELSIGLNLMKGTVGGAAALLIASAALAIVVPVMYALGNLSWEKISKGLITLAGALAVIGAAGLLLKPLIILILGLSASFALLGAGMIGIGAGLVLISAGITALSTALAAGATGIVAGLTVIVTGVLNLIPTIARIIGEGIVELAKVIGEYTPQLADSFLKLLLGVLQSLAENAPQISDAILDLLIGVINSLADHTPALIEALVNLFSKVFVGLVDALKSIGLNSVRDGLDIALGLSALMLAMSAALKIAGSISVGSAIKGVLALTSMAVPLIAFVGVLAVASGVDNATNNAKALAILAGACSLMLIPLTLIGGFIGPALLGVLSLTAMAIPMLAFVGVLALMNKVENATTNTILLTTLMTTMTNLLIKIALVAPLAVIGVAAMSGLTILIGAIGVMAVAIGALMDKFPSIQKFIDNGLPVLEQLAGSIGVMIGKFISGIGEGLGDTLVKMGEDIAEFMSCLSIASDNASGIKGESFDGVKQLMDVMGDIALTTVSTTIGDIFTIGGTSMDKFQKDGVAFFNAMKAIGEVSNGINIDEESMDSVIGVAQKLSDLQSSLEPIGGVIDWFTGRDDLGTFGTNAGQFISSMRTAFSSLDGVTLNNEAMNSIITATSSLAYLQSKLEPIGGVISWFTGRDDLATFGNSIGQFTSSMVAAFGSVNNTNINAEAMDTIIRAATSLANLQNSLEPIGGVITWFAGRDDLGTFGTNVNAFVMSMRTAFMSLDGTELNTEAMNSIIYASTRLSALQSTLEPIGGVITWFVGRDDLGTFGTNVAAFIESMKTAMVSLNDATFNSEALASIISAATGLAGLQSSLEPMGGVVDWFTGRDDLGTFGTNIGLFADAMKKLKDGMGENGIPETVVASVINAGTAIVELQKALPEEGWFDGKMNLSEFSNYVSDFGTAMSDFGAKAAEIDSGAVSTVINTAYRIKSLINSLVDLDTSGIETFTGIGTGGFGADGAAYKIAQTISKFSSEVAGINTEAVSVSVSSARQLKSLISSLAGLDTSGIENFKPQYIGSAMKGYADKVSGIDTGLVSSSITSANRLKNFIASLSGLDASGVDSFKTAINKLSTVNITELVKAFSGASAKLQSAGSDMINGLIAGMKSNLPSLKRTSNEIVISASQIIKSKSSMFSTAGQALITKLSAGFSSKKSMVITDVSSCVSSAASGLRNKYDSFYNAGSYLVGGFASGISDNAYKAAAKAKAMAEAAVKAAREALRINSPSKVFKEIGSGIPEGFAIGIGMLGNTVRQSVTDMTSTAIESTKSAMSNVLDALNCDMDSQPTIRPVIDLTDVRSGANSINRLFSGSQTVGVQTNLNAINSMMNRRSQNGVNDDVISAIDKLRKDVGNISTPSYNIGGITYDDGSNVSEAIKTLIRVAKIERRV